MELSEIQNLVESFESDILYDCHSLRSTICRSEVARKINSLSREYKDAFKDYLKKHEVVTAYPLLKEAVESGWAYVLS